MKNNVVRNVTLDANEKIYKDFRKLKSIKGLCQIMLTNKRLIIYTYGLTFSQGRRVRRKKMDEIDLRSIHQFEYHIDYQKHRLWVKIIGFLLFLGGLGLAYVVYANLYQFPAYPYSQYGNYVACGLIAIIGLSLWLKVKRTLSVKVKYGLNQETPLSLHADTYNELAIRYLGSKIHVS